MTLDPDASSSTCPSLKVDASSTPSYNRGVTGRHPQVTHACYSAPLRIPGKIHISFEGRALLILQRSREGGDGIPPGRKREAGHTSTKKRGDEGRTPILERGGEVRVRDEKRASEGI